MLKRLARILLVLLLLAALPVQGFAAASARCGSAGHDDVVHAAAGYDLASAQHPGHDGDGVASSLLDAHCAVGAAIPSSINRFAPSPPTGGVDPAMVLVPSGFVPDGLDRPPLTFLA